MYQLLTILAGLVFVAFGLFNFVRALISRDSVFAQLIPLRIILSGVLLILHQPLTDWLSTTFQEFMGVRGVQFGDTFSFWMSIAAMCAIQCIVLPSWRFLALSEAFDSLRQR